MGQPWPRYSGHHREHRDPETDVASVPSCGRRRLAHREHSARSYRDERDEHRRSVCERPEAQPRIAQGHSEVAQRLAHIWAEPEIEEQTEEDLEIERHHEHPVPANSLDAKLQNILSALNAVQSGSVANVCGQLNAFINETQAQSGKKLTVAQANQLIVAATRIKAVVGCQ